MVITVGRQYGSGGREIGTMLAKQLGIAYYDDMLLKGSGIWRRKGFLAGAGEAAPCSGI